MNLMGWNKQKIKKEDEKHMLDKDTKTKIQQEENLKNLEKEIVNKKKLPQEEENKINSKIFENMIIADILMAFFYLISLGSLNIETPIFMTDLKVFSIGLIVLTVIIFEISYKKENGNLCIHGIECLAISIFMLFSTYLYTMYMREFYMYISIFAYITAIYYAVKSIIIYRKMKKKYIASLSDIEKIVKK